MQWKTITTGIGNSAFTLWNNGRKLLTLAYKTQSDRVYIESSDGEKRYFKYRKNGLLKTNVVLENEYGTRLGKLKKEGERRYVLIDDNKYYLDYINKKEVAIIAENMKEPLTICNLDLGSSTPKAKEGLMMILCYYLLGLLWTGLKNIFNL